ncbi:MAG: ABC transporter substrate-binding protein [Firmicutes bacterium]|jgi:multiple sugar transport system substrate-binding protein|nr:ABC transporter substrate-binding protein [Bacillota bacterium]
MLGRHSIISKSCLMSALALVALLVAVGLAQAASKVQIELWTNHRIEDQPIFERLINEFMTKNPDIHVEWTNILDGGDIDWNNKIATSAAGGALPDVFYVRAGTDQQYFRSGFVYDIDAMIKRDADEIHIRDFVDSQLAELKVDGRWWAVPYDYSVIGLYYNIDMFDKAGLQHPTERWTWYDVIEAGKRLTVTDAEGLTVQWAFDNINWWFSQWCEGFFMSFGGSVFNEDFTAARLNTPGTVRALELPQSMAQIHRIMPAPGQASIGRLFFGGQAAMTLDGSWATTTHRLNNPFEWDVQMLPKGDTRVVSATGGAWAMASSTKHPEEAFRLLKWLASPNALRELIVKPIRSLPPRKSLMREWAKQITDAGFSPRNAYALAEQVLLFGRNIPTVSFRFHAAIGAYRDALLSGAISPQQAAYEMERELNNRIQEAARK